MTQTRPSLPMAIAWSFAAGAAVGVAGTLIAVRPSASASAPAASASSSTPSPSIQQLGSATGAPGAPATHGTGVFINQQPVEQARLDELKQVYGAAPPPGRYWYDSRSGLYGIWGHESAGYIKPGHDFGPLTADASNGNTGVVINGRQLNVAEVRYLMSIFGQVYQGRWWLDGRTGNFGQEGSEMPLGNLVAAVQAAQRSRGGGGGEYRWRDEINRSSGGAVNGCVWVSAPGSTYSSAGCG